MSDAKSPEGLTAAIDDLCLLGSSLSEHRSEARPWTDGERAAFERLETLLQNLDNWPMQTGLSVVPTDLWEQIVSLAREGDDLYLRVLVEKIEKGNRG